MVICYIHLYKQNIGWSFYGKYTYNTSRISDGHILHTINQSNQSINQNVFCNIIIILQGGSKVAWAIPKLPPNKLQ